jgi:hypothetical protein
MSADASPTLVLLCYAPLVWDPVLVDHPRAAPGYDWREHLHDLCRRAREIWQAAPIELRVAGEAERAFIWALADVPVEEMLLWMAAQGRPGRQQLDFADPHDEHEPAPKPAGRGRPDAYI